ncbi:class I SAM-dependent methyltransferase [Herminiimonas sp. CN]|uniref:class I SAM-dependent methyltransferase n=1 Tax=Herminiimonas sp. CN TaxID=1349818 RepID=UPI0012DC5B31|nr:class I SAM-dependent methyltransferase [Herminiimonas sp. CN]
MNPPNKKNNSEAKSILIFPGGMPRSLEYLQKCLREGQSVIGASSLAHDVSREKYPGWLSLPFITQPEFDQALKRAISESNIGGIYSPNPVVWDYLSRALAELAPGVTLVNDSPVNVELSGYRVARNHARSLLGSPLPLASNVAAAPPMSEIELAALFRHADVIPGMCDHEKFCVLCEIARSSPAGDIVEIGSWWGKSAFILSRLARCYAIGKLLCIDPWSNAHLVQNDGKGMVDKVSAQVDAEEALAVFEMNLLPYNANHVNYLRMPSTDGARHYRAHRDVTTASFGTTRYDGRIAILHIDGNHSYAAAKADIAAWSGLVVAGGWIVVDDYIWPYGDGPQTAGDEFLAEHQDKIDAAFVMGSALFLQLSASLATD